MNFGPETLPWYRSRIIVGAAVSILSKVLVLTGLVGDITGDDANLIADAIVLTVGGIGDLVAIGSRVVQKQAPTITATKVPS